MAETKEGIKVTGLNIFPIKSCKACPVQEITLDSYGVVGDRRFMLVDGSSRFISQRQYPILATVSVAYDANGNLRVSSNKMDTELVVSPVLDGPRKETTIWDDTVMTIDQGDPPAEWFSKLIGISYIRLVASAERTTPGFHRPVSNYPPTLMGKIPPMEMTLTDDGPISLISHESLSDLNKKYKEVEDHEVPLNRFRMNIEISGCSKPFEEDEWLIIRICNIPLLVYVDNFRCKMTAVDQTSGEVDKIGPLEILRKYRAPGGPTKAKFGRYMLPLQAGGKIKIGDTVTVLDRKK